jgi:hypothetical protein
LRVRALEKELADEKTNINRRVQIIDSLAATDQHVLDRRLNALQTNHRDGLISEQDYEVEMAKIKDDEAKLAEDTEQKKTDALKANAEKRKQMMKDEVDQIAQYITQALSGISDIADALEKRDIERNQAEQDRNKQMREAQAITEREFLARQKRLENEQKAIQRRAAIRERDINTFSALVNGAAAVVKAAPNPFLIAFTIALVAAQIAAIRLAPLPRFGKGTKSAPRGFAEVGETGTELIQTDRGYFVADHPQIVWMKGGERIYNPDETKNMSTPTADKRTMSFDRSRSQRSSNIDYKQLGKSVGDEIAKHPRFNVNLDEQGFSIYQQSRNAKQNYLNKRHRYNA